MNIEMNQLFKAYNQRPIAYHRIYSQVTGGGISGLVLSQIMYWWYACGEKEFYKTDESFYKEIGVGKYEFRAAKDKIKTMRIINTVIKKNPARTHYSVNIDKLFQLTIEKLTSLEGSESLEYEPMNMEKPNTEPMNMEKPNLEKPYCELGKTQFMNMEKPNTIYKETNKESNKDSKRITPPLSKTLSKASSNPKTYPTDSDEYLLASYMIELILERKPNFYQSRFEKPSYKEELIQKWCISAKRLLVTDKIELSRVIDAIDYTAVTPFFSSNILSLDKLRARFDEIELSMQRDGFKVFKEPDDPNAEITKKVIRSYGILINNLNYQPLKLEDKLKFIETSKKMIAFYESHSIIRKNWLEYLAKCMEKNYKDKGDTLYPGHMSSKHTWEVLMPQFIAELGIGR